MNFGQAYEYSAAYQIAKNHISIYLVLCTTAELNFIIKQPLMSSYGRTATRRHGLTFKRINLRKLFFKLTRPYFLEFN